VPDTSKPTVTVNLTVFVGSRHENYGEKGMAHLFEHMLFKETKKFKDVKKALSEHGGNANGSTWFDRTNYFETLPATDDNLKWAIELEAERLVNAIITREKLAPEMTVVRNEFESGENQPGSVLEDRLLSAAYTWHNYGNTTIGARSDIELVPTERLQALYAQYYQPDNAMLIVAGKFDPAKTFKWIGDTFAKIPKPKRALPATYTVEPVQDGERALTIRRAGGTPVLMAGYHVPAGTDPDFAAVDVLTRVLGDAPSGRLYKDLVETKKAARVSCSTFQLREPGFLTCSAELRAGEKTEPARDAMLAALEGVEKKPITQAEVDRAKATMLKRIELLLNSSEAIGKVLSEYAAMGDWRMLFIHRDRVKAVTADEVTRVAQKYSKASNRTFGEYVPTEKLDRAEVPALVDLKPVLASYKGAEALAQGEVFDASPKNIDARTVKSALPNGMKLALLPKKTRGETVQLVLRLDYGTAATLMNQKTANTFAARLLQRGTKTKTRQQFQDAVDALKLGLNIGAQPQGLLVMMEVRRPQLMAALDLVAEALKTPAFDEKELEAARREVLSDAEQKKDDPQAVGMVGMQRMMNTWEKGHPYYVPSWPEQIADATALKLQQVKDFHAKFYGAQNGYVAAVGDFDAPELTAKLTALFGDWKAKEKYERIPKPYQPLETVDSNIETPDKAMAFIGVGVNFKLKDTDPDYPPMVMADYMLGGGFLAGRVPQRLREKEGLSYGAGTFMRVGDREENGALMGYAIYAPQNLEKVEKGFREEISKAVEGGFTDGELKLARQGIMQRREQQRANDRGLAMTLVDNLDLDRTMAFQQQLDDKLKALSNKEIGASLQKYVDPKRLSMVKVGDFKKVVVAPK